MSAEPSPASEPESADGGAPREPDRLAEGRRYLWLGLLFVAMGGIGMAVQGSRADRAPFGLIWISIGIFNVAFGVLKSCRDRPSFQRQWVIIGLSMLAVSSILAAIQTGLQPGYRWLCGLAQSLAIKGGGWIAGAVLWTGLCTGFLWTVKVLRIRPEDEEAEFGIPMEPRPSESSSESPGGRPSR